MYRQERFPLVADDDVIVAPTPQMDLYDESDLISNIKGFYQDKEYASSPSVTPLDSDPAGFSQDDLLPPLFYTEPSGFSRKKRFEKLPLSSTTPKEKTQGQLAREQAKEDLKKKRSAAYLKEDKPHPQKRILIEKSNALVDKPVEKSSLGHLSDRLRQTSYILADIPTTYSLEKEERLKEATVKKNSYDFLKKSQVYNYPQNKLQRDQKMAQELNLTYIEED